MVLMEWRQPFDATHAEREIQRMDAAPQRAMWTAPNGSRFDLTVPPTVYPPREDTDLLASAISAQRMRPGARWLEIGCGSGALSLYAASLGCDITACDVNPMAVAATRAHLEALGLGGRVHEGGPGPTTDGTPEQWGGDRLYDVVVWNTPYLPSTVLQDGALGPMEEAALVDTDAQGLVQRLFSSVSAGRLLTQTGVAFLTVSSVGFADRAQTWAWLGGLAARTVATMRFEDGESLSVLAVWRPFSQAQIVHLPVVNSTNDELLNGDAPIGTTVRTNQQTAGRGRRGRTWTNQPGAMMASWLVGVDAGSNHRTIDQLRVGEGLQRMIRAWSTLPPDRIQLKWPNDLYTFSEGGRPQKAGGVLFEGATKGSHHRIVLGLGLNLQNALTTEFGSLTDVGVSIDAARVHSCVHGMVASLFEDVAGVPLQTADGERIEQAVLEGIRVLGPLFYSGKEATVTGLSEAGGLITPEGNEPIVDPDDVAWSGV